MSSETRPNPEQYSGSLIYWLEVPSDQQHFLHGILDGCDGLGYYQTMAHGWGSLDGGRTSALARITSTEDGREEMKDLIEELAADFGVRLLEEAPDIPPDMQPGSRKPESEFESKSEKSDEKSPDAKQISTDARRNSPGRNAG